MRYFVCLLMISVWLGFGSQVSAVENAAVDYLVVSEYQSPMPGHAVNVVRWQFKEAISADGGYVVEVEDSGQKVGCRAEFYYGPSHRLEQADCFRWVKGAEVCSANQYDSRKPALLNSTIIPGDWLNRSLPFVSEAGKRDMVLYEQIGTSRFANYIEVQDRQISRDEAFAKGLLREDLQSDLPASGEICFVEVRRVVNGDGRDVLLQQLWLAGDNFWLYEAKAGRRSWRGLQK